jgi:hypothetical protein
MVTDLVTEVLLVTPEEAGHVARDVLAHRDSWRQRDEVYPFFTLGAASYLDGRLEGAAAYEAYARASNGLLHRSFAWLHDRLRLAVSRHVDAEATYAPGLALPGFHVFLSHDAFRRPTASLHYDLQYTFIDWTGRGTPDGDRQLSLTLPITLPSLGGGLRVWNIDRRKLERMSASDRGVYAATNRSATTHDYTVGQLVLHSGHLLHQIAHAPELKAGEMRITLQAHALPVDGRWVIYW